MASLSLLLNLFVQKLNIFLQVSLNINEYTGAAIIASNRGVFKCVFLDKPQLLAELMQQFYFIVGAVIKHQQLQLIDFVAILFLSSFSKTLGSQDFECQFHATFLKPAKFQWLLLKQFLVVVLLVAQDACQLPVLLQ